MKTKFSNVVIDFDMFKKAKNLSNFNKTLGVQLFKGN